MIKVLLILGLLASCSFQSGMENYRLIYKMDNGSLVLEDKLGEISIQNSGINGKIINTKLDKEDFEIITKIVRSKLVEYKNSIKDANELLVDNEDTGILVYFSVIEYKSYLVICKENLEIYNFYKTSQCNSFQISELPFLMDKLFKKTNQREYYFIFE